MRHRLWRTTLSLVELRSDNCGGNLALSLLLRGVGDVGPCAPLILLRHHVVTSAGDYVMAQQNQRRAWADITDSSQEQTQSQVAPTVVATQLSQAECSPPEARSQGGPRQSQSQSQFVSTPDRFEESQGELRALMEQTSLREQASLMEQARELHLMAEQASLAAGQIAAAYICSLQSGADDAARTSFLPSRQQRRQLPPDVLEAHRFAS